MWPTGGLGPDTRREKGSLKRSRVLGEGPGSCQEKRIRRPPPLQTESKGWARTGAPEPRPHPDHPPDYIPEVERLVAQLPESARVGFLGRNIIEAYRLEG